MDRPDATSSWCRALVVLAGVLGLGLMAHEAVVSSATYDEVAYLEIAARWWRGGKTATITRMGSPATFFKLQAGPVFGLLDRLGRGELIDAAAGQSTLLPIVRVGALWIWLVAFGLTTWWSREIYDPRAMAFAAVLFAISPNLLAHGSLATMEFPLIAGTTAMALLFWRFLETGSRRALVAGAVVGGLAFSCKFTTILIPPILAAIWAVDLWLGGERNLQRIARKVIGGMTVYGLVLVAANLVVTGFAMLPPSERVGEHPTVPGLMARLVETPLPKDWVGFATQVRHQRNGGPSYLFGERRMTGWRYYYLVALAVKLPIACVMLLAVRIGCVGLPSNGRSGETGSSRSRSVCFWPLRCSDRNGTTASAILLPLAPSQSSGSSGLAGRGKVGWAWLGLARAGGAGGGAALDPPARTELLQRRGGRADRGTVRGFWPIRISTGGRGSGRSRRSSVVMPSMTLFYFGDTEPANYGIRADAFVDNGERGPSAAPLRDAGYDPLSGRLGFAPAWPVGTGRLFLAPRRARTGGVYRRPHDCDLRPESGSIEVSTPRKSIFEAVRRFGDPADEIGGVDPRRPGRPGYSG